MALLLSFCAGCNALDQQESTEAFAPATDQHKTWSDYGGGYVSGPGHLRAYDVITGDSRSSGKAAAGLYHPCFPSS